MNITTTNNVKQTRSLFYFQVWTCKGRRSHMSVHDPLFYLSPLGLLKGRRKGRWRRSSAAARTHRTSPAGPAAQTPSSPRTELAAEAGRSPGSTVVSEAGRNPVVVVAEVG